MSMFVRGVITRRGTVFLFIMSWNNTANWIFDPRLELFLTCLNVVTFINNWTATGVQEIAYKC